MADPTSDNPASSPISTLLAAAMPGILSRAKVVVSPYPFALSDDDSLRVTSVNALPGIAIEVHLRRVTKDGAIVPDRFVHTPNSNRVAKSEDFQLTGGFVSNMTAFVTGGTPLIGQTFVIVQMIRGMGASAFVLGTLLAGPVTAVQGIGWPGSAIQSSVESGGYLRQVIGTQPAFGAEIQETVPAGARWDLIACQLTLATSAAAGVRQTSLILQPFTGRFFASGNPGTIAAGTTSDLYWAQGMPLATVVAANSPTAGLPTAATLLAGFVITTGTKSIDAGDRYSAPVLIVRETLEAA